MAKVPRASGKSAERWTHSPSSHTSERLVGAIDTANNVLCSEQTLRTKRRTKKFLTTRSFLFFSLVPLTTLLRTTMRVGGEMSAIHTLLVLRSLSKCDGERARASGGCNYQHSLMASWENSQVPSWLTVWDDATNERASKSHFQCSMTFNWMEF